MAKMVELKETLNIDRSITADNLFDDIYTIYSELFKDVNKEDLIFDELQGGFVNSMINVYPKNDKNKALVFRTFGLRLNLDEFNKSLNEMGKVNEKTAAIDLNQTNQDQPKNFDINTMIFNRITEYKVMNEVSKYNLCKPVYAKYANGLCYGFNNGITLNGPLMLTHDFLNEMATKLAQFHSIKLDLENIKFKTNFERMNSQFAPMMEQMIEVIETNMTKIGEFPYNQFPKLSTIAVTQQKIIALLSQIGFGEITFCHNDLNQRNLIWSPQDRKLSFIDFEMAMNDYAILEIGQLFYCYTGHFLYDFEGEFFPGEDYRRSFLKKYLSEKNKLNNSNIANEKVDDSEIEKLLIQTNLATLEFFTRMIIMTPFFDFKPEMFHNQDLIKARKETKYYCGKFGYKVYTFFDRIKDDLIRSAEVYISKNRQN